MCRLLRARGSSARGLRSENLLDLFRQHEIQIADALHAVRGQIEAYAIPDIRPFGMVVHGFGNQGHTSHVTERGVKILTFKLFVELPTD